METGWATGAAGAAPDATASNPAVGPESTASVATDAPDPTSSVATDDASEEEEAQRVSIDAVDELLDEVEQALARLEDGTYGRCERCGEPIGDERLTELAIVRTCAACASEPAATEPAATEQGETD